ncbi:ferrous iron transport protein A [Gulosibacter macacae]|uniref:Ferrous iron transport protein A n=1 Tax=Gulosibacter macacae TaxID=2488791 RepID=A0A3P3VYD7_9MICO|nr:ferrous iron transport protein A [Gulosibacter macacae]
MELDVPAAEGALRRRLAELGLRCGECVCPMQRTPGGGRILVVGGSRLALDRDTCALLRIVGAEPTAR